MSTTISITTAAVPATLTGPADGEAKTAASVNTTFQQVLNGLEAVAQCALAKGYATWGDAAQTMSAGEEWHQSTTTTGVLVHTLDETTVVPVEGARIRAYVDAGAFLTDFQREDATSIARITGAATDWIEFVWSGADWYVSEVGTAASWSLLTFV